LDKYEFVSVDYNGNHTIEMVFKRAFARHASVFYHLLYNLNLNYIYTYKSDENGEDLPGGHNLTSTESNELEHLFYKKIQEYPERMYLIL
jgi:hypothetical protein